MRAIQRLFGVSRPTLARWLKKVDQEPSVRQTRLPAREDDVREIDELWSFVGKKGEKRWLWAALCRRTRPAGCGLLPEGSQRADLWKSSAEGV